MTKAVEVITSVQRRRRWSRAEKERIVAAALEPGASASEVARAAGIPREPIVPMAPAALWASADTASTSSCPGIGASSTAQLKQPELPVTYPTAFTGCIRRANRSLVCRRAASGQERLGRHASRQIHLGPQIAT
jgi:hypothetical protein